MGKIKSMDSKSKFKVIGLMSGTSFDGLDIAYCHFSKLKTGWRYAIKNATTIQYPSIWQKKLSTAQHLTGPELVALDMEYGKFLGKACDLFMREHQLKVDFIASHGHTIFHQPAKGFTCQIGNGNAVYASCGIPVIYDFRSLDVQLGGEGAPLVPVGDKFLFSEYDVCLNLGGIANLSMDVKGKRVAYDICFVNMGLNYLAKKMGKAFDEGGRAASMGAINASMLKKLNRVYASLRGKRPSLGREIFEQRIEPVLNQSEVPIQDRLRTFMESAASEIASVIVKEKKNAKVLCTGGGTFNSFFVSCLLEHCGDQAALIIPEEDVVKFKEALVFSFLGVLRWKGQPNCLKSVTGASRDSCGGVLVGM
jgi:anhydro-N-acetylmuramic acid kinase